MLNKKEFIPAGTIAKPHGISGETSIRLLPELVIHDIAPTFIFIEIDKELVPFRVSSYRYKGENVILVKLPLLASEEKIRSVMESNVFISPEEIEESPPEFKSLDTFTGYSVKNTKTGFIGTITGIQDISGNPLFIIENPRGEILVPVAEELIVAINDSTKEIEMEISDGLLDINLP